MARSRATVTYPENMDLLAALAVGGAGLDAEEPAAPQQPRPRPAVRNEDDESSDDGEAVQGVMTTGTARLQVLSAISPPLPKGAVLPPHSPRCLYVTESVHVSLRAMSAASLPVLLKPGSSCPRHLRCCISAQTASLRPL